MSALACTVFSAWVAACFGEVIKGVSYGPVPLRSSVGAAEVPADDWFCDAAVPMWGSAGRADLAVMQGLGANLVRLYGNNPDTDHTNFLDEAHSRGLSVAPGMSDFPFYQQDTGSCQETGFDCFTQVKPLYLSNLRKGFMNVANSYHPALKYMNIINEPDLKMPWNADIGGLTEVYQMCRAIISAFDGMLEAEKEAGVTGELINFTATFSFAVCQSCEFSHGKPALAQMLQLDDAMRNPSKYGYSPTNNITTAYLERFTHSFNTQNPARDIELQFLDAYEEKFPGMPVYIAEYHHPGGNQTEDLEDIMRLAESSDLFLGISFFQFQVAYWKTGSEMDFGMFGLGDEVVASMPYFSKTYDIFCLEPEQSPATGRTLAEAITQVYGGPGLDATTLCSANPLGVQLDQAGYVQIASQQSVSQMALFVQRALSHMGASVRLGSHAQLESFAEIYSGDVGDDAFAQMAAYLGSKPAWTEFDPEARCVADRAVHPSIIGSAIGWVCSQSAMCDDIPQECEANPYRSGDFVFSRFATEARATGAWNPLLDCSFGGAALFAPSELYEHWAGASACVVAGASTTSRTSLTSTATETGTTTETRTTSTGTASAGAGKHRDAIPTATPPTSARHIRGPQNSCLLGRPWISVVFLGVLVGQMWR